MGYLIPEGKWNKGWLVLLFSPIVAFVGLELYSWVKQDPTKPTVSRILAKTYPKNKLGAMTILACIALLLHWQMVRHDWSMRYKRK